MKGTLLAAAVAGLACLPQPAAAQQTSKPKKLIEWGWDEPDTRFMRENVQKMEQLPFDGLVFHVNSGKGGSLVWEMWGSRRFDLAEFETSVRPALEISDEYVWVYTEKPLWWTNQRLPQAYVDALKRARSANDVPR